MFRIAFLTDAHLKAPADDEHNGNDRAKKAFAAARDAKPDLVIFGGDNVMAVDGGVSTDAATAQMENWREVLKREVTAPFAHVIGNHDIWYGPDATAHPKGGKQYALDAFAMPNRYYHVDAGAWRFLMLDSFHDDGCYIDDEQMDWLKAQIASAPGPVAVVSHASVVNSGHILESTAPGRVAGYNSPAGWVLGNAADVVRLFARSGKVKLALSGHMHQVDRIDLVGTSYICGGAVSGAWWGGDYLEFFPCNLLQLDLDDTGVVAWTNIEYEGPATALRRDGSNE